MTKSIKPPRRRMLTELFVRKQKGGPRTTLTWDAEQRHLALRTQPSGSRAWYVVYSRHGRPRWLRLGDARSIGIKDARIRAAETMLSVEKDDKDPAAERKAQRSKGTFEELAKRYVDEYAKKKNKSYKQAEFLVRRYLLPKWGKLQVGAISRADVKAIMDRIEAPSLANQILASASAVFSWAADEQIIAANTNPCTGVASNETKTRERVLGDSEIPKFWAAFDDDAGLIAGTALKTILLLGQRPGEVANMRREHISDNWWTLPGDPVPALGWPGTKNGQTHRVWLPAPVLELLAELDDEPASGFVFAGGRNRLAGAMRAICTKLKAERATPHDLRRTHGTTITGLGLGRHIMDVIQNHKKRGVVTDTYDRYAYGPEIKNAMELVAAHLAALAHGTEANVVPMVAAGRGAGFARYKASPAHDTLVERTLAERDAVLTPRPPKGK